MIIALNAILSQYDSGFVLILGVYYKLQSFLFFIVSGLAQGIRPLISYNEGSGNIKGWIKLSFIRLSFS